MDDANDNNNDNNNDNDKTFTEAPPWLSLNLPDQPEFISIPPVFTAAEMIRMCEQQLPYWNKRKFVDGHLPPEPRFDPDDPFVTD